MQTLYQVVKILHIIGFATAIGFSMATHIAYNQFWKMYGSDRQQEIVAFRTCQAMQKAGMFGLLLVLVAGLGMLALVQWSYLSVLWFQLKLALIALLFVNGFTLGRTSSLKMQHLIEQEQRVNDSDIKRLKRSQMIFQLIQLAIFTGIIVLSVFRIN